MDKVREIIELALLLDEAREDLHVWVDWAGHVKSLRVRVGRYDRNYKETDVFLEGDFYTDKLFDKKEYMRIKSYLTNELEALKISR